MIRITNPKKGPIQIVVRSRTHNGGFTTLTIPGIGGKNYYDLADELTTEYIEKARIDGFIKIEERKNTANEGE